MHKKAFTLVELIVVITILAILGTIGFISLNNYNNDARNTKVETDLRNLAGAIEVSRTRNNLRIIDAVKNITTSNTISGTEKVYAGSSTVSSSGVTYLVGTLDFTKIGQNSEGFQDPNSFDKKQEYVYAAIMHHDFSYFQLAGQIIEDDMKKAQLKGTYAQLDFVQDTTSLISSKANTTPLEDREVMIGDLYQ